MKSIFVLIILVTIGLILFKFDQLNREKLSNYIVQDSELALLMRDIHEQAKLMKDQLVLDESIEEFNQDFYFILDANPTRPSVRGEKYEAFARYYLAKNKEAFDHPGSISYNEMVESCVVCHKQFCPGPVRTIKKLTIN